MVKEDASDPGISGPCTLVFQPHRDARYSPAPIYRWRHVSKARSNTYGIQLVGASSKRKIA